MRKRVFLHGLCNYPRGSAKANYMQYLSMALKEAGYDVYLNSNLNDEFRLLEQDGTLEYNGVKIIPFHMSKNKVISFIERNLRGHFVVNMLKQHNITREDIVILISPDVHVHREILNYKKKIGFKTVSCPLEWFPMSQFKSRREWKANNAYFDQFLPRHDLLFPISTYIENHLMKQNCKTMCLPIMADVREHSVGTKSFDKIKFIFPGNGMMKDAIEVILKSFSQLTSDDKKRVELHLCGVKQKQIEEALTEQEYEGLKDVLVIHKWMKYNELITLYQSVHFLMLAREENQMTLANFPSKVPEVMCYGVIPIVSRVGDYTKYYLEDNVNSLIFDGCDIDLCLDKINHALSMTQTEIAELSARSRECAEKKFDYRNWVGKIHYALESI